MLRRNILIASIFLAYIVGAHSSTAAELVARFEIPNSSVHTITSENLGRSYDIFVKVPANYGSDSAAKKQYPVFYLNDGPYTFQVASGVTHLPMNMGVLEQALIVVISFANGENGMDSRVRDLTPTEDKSWIRYQTGGGPEY